MVDPVISARQAASGNTTNLTNTTLTTDFNVVPYYDDYNPSKNYYRILFKPGYAVQARELTQIQSMLQNQIYRFGRHIFKEGSLVLPGAFTIKTNVGSQKGNPMDYVKLKNVDGSNNTVDVTSFLGAKITGASSGIIAYVADVAETDGTSANSKTLYVNYLNASPANSRQRVFIAGETLNTSNNLTCIVKNNDPVANTGYASWFQIEEGVYFAKEHFIYFPTQSIVLDRYNPNPTCKVGFYVTEELVNAAQDSSLLDPALESSNYSAPGADRLKLLSTLTVLPYSEEEDSENFVTLFTIQNGVVVKSNERTEYNKLADELANRTYDESGDYVVKGLNVDISEHDRISTPVNNYGRYNNGNNNLLVISVDPGYGYVKGYGVSVGNRREINLEKPKNFNNVTSQIASASQGQYLRTTEFVGSWPSDRSARVNFYDTVQKRISTGKWSIGSQTGNNIGSALVHSVQYVSGTPGYDAIYDIYLSDIQMVGSNSRSLIRSVYYNNSPYSDAGADVLGANNSVSNTSIFDTNKSAMLYFVGSKYTKTVRDKDGNPQTIYYYTRTDGISSALTMPASGIAVITPSLPTSEIIPYGEGVTLSSTDITQDLLLTVNESFNIGPLYGATVSASGKNLTGTGFNYLNVGDKIEVSGLSNTFYISAISSNTALTVTEAFPPSTTGNSLFKVYKTGDILNLTGKGADGGVTRSIVATSTSFTIDLKETLGADRSITFSYKVGSTSSVEKIKTLKPNRYVIISCATAGTTGPFCLGFPDVYKIRNVISKVGSAPTNLSDGTNVTKFFTLDNGQRDTLYDLAYISKVGTLSLTGTTFLLVEFDYFEHTVASRDGFFTIDSYPVEDNDANSSNSTIRTEALPNYRSPITGTNYDLRNHIDFRPAKVATATDSTTVAGATTNPSSSSNTYNFSAATGLKLPIPSSEIIFDYSYYLARRDIIVANKDGQFAVMKGTPGENPSYPIALDTQMLLATLDIAPYPSLSPNYASALGRKDLACSAQKVSNRRYTMRDIGVLDDRIKVLEYYASLSLLESNALNLKITDNNGLDRFKNGIFIDTFKDLTLSAYKVDPDHRIVIDPIELSIRPFYSKESFGYDTISTSDVTVKNGVALLTYTETVHLQQKTVTNSRNIERGNYLFQGKMELVPNQDVWVDPNPIENEIVTLTSATSLLNVSTNLEKDVTAVVKKNLLNTVWEDWKTTITGYNLYSVRNGVKTKINQSVIASEAAARQQATAVTNQEGVTAVIEVLYQNDRKGTEIYSNASTDTAAGSTKVISSEVIPYIRPQTIYASCWSLKPRSKMNAFFDGVNVSDFCTPLSKLEYDALSKKLPVSVAKKKGDDLIVDESGKLYFAYEIEKGKFRTGSRRLIVLDGEKDNIQQLAEEQDASTIASVEFFADGTKQTTQRTIYSTKGFSTSTNPTSQTTGPLSYNIDLPNTYTPPPVEIGAGEQFTGGDGGNGGSDGTGSGGGGDCPGCVAYSVIIRLPQSEEGMFCTGFDVFMQRKSAVRGIWCEIREVSDIGLITRVQIPGSEKRYDTDEVVVSPDGITSPMQVRFDSPVFLFNNKEYAFVVHSDNPVGEDIDPDTSIWIARIGETDLNTTGKPYNDRQLKGKFFTTTNNRRWDIVEDVDIPLTIYRANFTSSSGTITLGNDPVEKLLLKNVVTSPSISQIYRTGDTLKLINANGTISVGDRLYGNVSTGKANGTVISISGSNYLMTNTNYLNTDYVDVYYASNGVYKGVTAKVDTVANGSAIMTYYDEDSTAILAEFENSTGLFNANTVIRNINDYTERAEVESVANYRYSSISLEPKVLDFVKTSLDYEIRGIANGTTSFTSWQKIQPEKTIYLDDERVLLSRTSERNTLSGQRSSQLKVTLNSTSKYVSPVFDLDSSKSIYIDNIISNIITNENLASGGQAINKYISQTITLADGQDAEDLRVYLTAYRPPGTEVHVYAKLLNAQDGDSFSNKLWTKMSMTDLGVNNYSTKANRNNFKEYTFELPNSVMTGPNGEYQYTSDSITYSGFKYFAIKIVLTATNSSLVPRVADLRAIALQM